MYCDSESLHMEWNHVSSSVWLVHLNWVACQQHDHSSVENFLNLLISARKTNYINAKISKHLVLQTYINKLLQKFSRWNLFINSIEWSYGPQEMQWSKQNHLAWTVNIENFIYQIWAADVDISCGKLVFEINIVGQPRFPLRHLKKKWLCWKQTNEAI